MPSPDQTSPERAPAPVPAVSILLIGCATLLFEILLTRIFSVTMWYHFAFVAVSLALFGIGCSGVVVSVLPRLFTRERATRQMGIAALLFGLAVPLGFAIDLRLPFVPFDAVPEGAHLELLRAHALFAAKFLVLGAPFFLSGLVIALAFTHGEGRVHRIYFVDLVGGGLGCAAAIPLLTWVSGPTAIVLAGALPCLAALGFFRRAGARRAAWAAALAATLVFTLGALNEAEPFLRVERVKSYDPGRAQEPERPTVYERWHPVSRVAVHALEHSGNPVRWFYSEPFPADFPPVLEVTNDAGARTFIYPKLSEERARELFTADLSDLGLLLLEEPKVLVVGVGGGKDVVSALHLGASEVHAIELNPLMIEVVQEVFGDFSGRPHDDPRVRVRIDEGRSFVASHELRFDLITISVTDTWAASAGGAYALNESYLYTIEAFEDFVSHLEPGGWLSVTRWYPQETLRLTSLAAEGLRRRGHERPAEHVLAARNGQAMTLLVKDSAVTEEEAGRFARAVEAAGHVLLHAPGLPPTQTGRVEDELHRAILQAPDLESVLELVTLDLRPPTDDRPFFFSLVSFGDARMGLFGAADGFQLQHGRALALLAGLLQVTTLVALAFLLGPLLLRRGGRLTSPWGTRLLANAYFLCLGFGYLLVEIPLLQRFTLYLGHPLHSLTAVLSAMLISSGLGSLAAGQGRLGEGRRPLVVIAVAVALLLVMTALLPGMLRATIGLPLPARYLLTVAFIAPIGFTLGMPFPLGLARLHRLDAGLVPWAWAVNGAASVAAPVVAMMAAIASGFSTAFLLGTAAYVVAALLFAPLGRRADRAPTG